MSSFEKATEQMEHLAMHGWQPHHWHVGVTALDAQEVRTEDVTMWFGLPVYRMLDTSREYIRCVPREQSSCHWPNGTA